MSEIFGALDLKNDQDHTIVAHRNKSVPAQTQKPCVNKLLGNRDGEKEVYPHLTSLVNTSYKNKFALAPKYKYKCKDFVTLSCKSKCKDIADLTDRLNKHHSFQDKEISIMAV